VSGRRWWRFHPGTESRSITTSALTKDERALGSGLERLNSLLQVRRRPTADLLGIVKDDETHLAAMGGRARDDSVVDDFPFQLQPAWQNHDMPACQNDWHPARKPDLREEQCRSPS